MKSTPNRSTRRVPFGLVPLVGICAAFILTDSVPAASQGSALSAGAARKDIAWVGCGEDLQCARVRVPLDWDRPDGRTIRLAVIRHLASKPGERIGTLFINPGGPGDTGVGLVRASPPASTQWGGGRFDVRQLGSPRHQREHAVCAAFAASGARRASGRARSIPTHQGRLGALCGTRPPTWRGAAARSAAGSCPTSRPPTPPATSTTCAACSASAKLTYVGLSYGTYLGQTYANMFPGRVRAMLLDGHRRCGPVLEGGRGEGRQRAPARPTRSSTSSSRSASGAGHRALRARRRRADRGRARQAAVRAVRRAPIPAPGASRVARQS